MPLPESTQAATLSFDAAVHRALSRRLADTPYPHSIAAVTAGPASPIGTPESGADASTEDASRSV